MCTIKVVILHIFVVKHRYAIPIKKIPKCPKKLTVINGRGLVNSVSAKTGSNCQSGQNLNKSKVREKRRCHFIRAMLKPRKKSRES